MSTEDAREQAAVVALLASLPWAWRICPRCNSLSYIRSSCRRPGGTAKVAYLVCSGCGKRFKRIVKLQNTGPCSAEKKTAKV